MPSSYSSDSNHGKHRRYERQTHRYKRTERAPADVVKSSSSRTPPPRSKSDKVNYSSHSSSYKYENTNSGNRKSSYERTTTGIDRCSHRDKSSRKRHSDHIVVAYNERAHDKYTKSSNREVYNNSSSSTAGGSRYYSSKDRTGRAAEDSADVVRSSKVPRSSARISSRCSSPYDDVAEGMVADRKSRRHLSVVDSSSAAKRYKDKKHVDLAKHDHHTRSGRELDNRVRERRGHHCSDNDSSDESSNGTTVEEGPPRSFSRTVISTDSRSRRRHHGASHSSSASSLSNRNNGNRHDVVVDDNRGNSRHRHGRYDRHHHVDRYDVLLDREKSYRHPSSGTSSNAAAPIKEEQRLLIDALRKRRHNQGHHRLYENEYNNNNNNSNSNNNNNNNSSSGGSGNKPIATEPAAFLLEDNFLGGLFFNRSRGDPSLASSAAIGTDGRNKFYDRLGAVAAHNFNRVAAATVDDPNTAAADIVNRHRHQNLPLYHPADFYHMPADIHQKIFAADQSPPPTFRGLPRLNADGIATAAATSSLGASDQQQHPHQRRFIRKRNFQFNAKTGTGRNWRVYNKYNNVNDRGNNKYFNRKVLSWNKNRLPSSTDSNEKQNKISDGNESNSSGSTSKFIIKPVNDDAAVISHSGLSDISDNDSNTSTHVKTKESDVEQQINNDADVTTNAEEIPDKLIQQPESASVSTCDDLNEFSVIDEITVDSQKEDDKQSVENDSEDETDLFTVSQVSDILGIDWECLVTESKKDDNSHCHTLTNVRERWDTFSILDRIGVSMKYAGPVLFEEIKQTLANRSPLNEDIKNKNQELAKNNECRQNPLLHSIAGIHSCLRQRAKKRALLFEPYKKAVSVRDDIVIRRQLNNLPVKNIEFQNSVNFCNWMV